MQKNRCDHRDLEAFGKNVKTANNMSNFQKITLLHNLLFYWVLLQVVKEC